MVEHGVTIDHSFVSGSGAAVVAHVDPDRNTIEVVVRLVPGGESTTMSLAELLELSELFSSAAAFLHGKPDHVNSVKAKHIQRTVGAAHKELVG